MSAEEKVLSSLSNRLLYLEETIDVPEQLNIGEDIVEYVQYDRNGEMMMEKDEYPAENSVENEEKGADENNVDRFNANEGYDIICLSFCFISQFNR